MPCYIGDHKIVFGFQPTMGLNAAFKLKLSADQLYNSKVTFVPFREGFIPFATSMMPLTHRPFSPLLAITKRQDHERHNLKTRTESEIRQERVPKLMTRYLKTLPPVRNPANH